MLELSTLGHVFTKDRLILLSDGSFNRGFQKLCVALKNFCFNYYMIEFNLE